MASTQLNFSIVFLFFLPTIPSSKWIFMPITVNVSNTLFRWIGYFRWNDIIQMQTYQMQNEEKSLCEIRSVLCVCVCISLAWSSGVGQIHRSTIQMVSLCANIHIRYNKCAYFIYVSFRLVGNVSLLWWRFISMNSSDTCWNISYVYININTI